MKSVAENKKSQNIAEYLIYMYQMEDLIRSYQGDIKEIDKYVVSKYPVSDEEKIDISVWFGELIAQMKSEGILEKGHLSQLNKLVEELAQIHWKLLKIDRSYFEIYNKAKPHILEAIVQAEGKDLGNEIQICLNGVYGLLLCRLLGNKVSDKQLQSTEAFGEVLSLLSLSFKEA
ncbi:MAG: DUF4924 family protein [Algoriphagus sp.]|uniref:DUF4924 family protein n=1 Tax=Algoriphagus sp. TaxID=1872435 RepID=UPI002610CCBB|nr:DUF4924 family protein [Algoriphagus sp.]MDG1276815.1 DUF4924 family protein [Algoriphagus sp.]